MNKEQQIEALKKTIELASKQIAELEKPKFEICNIGFTVLCNGDLIGVAGNDLQIIKRGSVFATAEIARKVDKIIEPSRFIAQYVFWREPDYVPSYDRIAESPVYICYDHQSKMFNYAFSLNVEAQGVVVMPVYIATELCEILNNGEYKLGTDL